MSPPDGSGRDAGASGGRGGPDDPVLRRREQARSLVNLGQRAGYTLFGLFVVLMIVGFVIGFPGWLTVALTVCLVAGSIVLAPAMVFAYAIKAAERDDAEHGF